MDSATGYIGGACSSGQADVDHGDRVIAAGVHFAPADLDRDAEAA
jgi:hypothetical protein